ncbi:MAG: glycoside hydrolase family 13 protein [Nocardioidaceae bacterium]
MTPSGHPWWRNAICYEIYVRSFADSDGDGVGDIRGATSRLDYLACLGVDAIWLTPFYRSPQADHGYDVADYRDVDPLFGTLGDVDALLAQAHQRGLRVIVDVVPNHSSDAHPWFVAALAAGPGGPERARYIFRDGRGRDGSEPPNNWESVFGGPAWTRVPDGQWYLHLFDSAQPDFDWSNPDVGDDFETTLRFWLDRGVDGFRIDVAHGMVKSEGLPDVSGPQSGSIDQALSDSERPYWDQPGVHDVYRRWRRILADYPGDRMAIGEAWVSTAEAMARYIRPDELQQTFNFHWLEAEWSAKEFRQVVADTFSAVDPVDASPTWVLANHDVVRTVTRYGGGATGLARARAAMLAMLALPGSAYLYQGDELGLAQVDVPAADRRDPTWLRGGGVGRDGCRVPLPWTVGPTPYGFGPDGSTPWLPQPVGWGDLSVEAQDASSGSTLGCVRAALAMRRELVVGLDGRVEMLDLGEDVFAYHRRGPDGSPGLVCVLNAGSQSVDVSALGAVALSSGDLPASATGERRASAKADGRDRDPFRGVLPPDTAAWLRP